MHVERLLQYIDDLDDLIGVLGLLTERLYRLATLALSACIVIVVTLAGVLLALAEPRLGLATAILLFVTLLYRAVTEPSPPRRAA